MALAFAITLAGCKSAPPALVTSSVRPVAATDGELPRRPWVPEMQPMPGMPGKAPRVQALSMRRAVEMAVAYSPAAKAAFAEIDARHADAAQASYQPNPELSVEVEDFGGSRSKTGFDEAQTTVSLSQVVELGDKRVKRLAAANLEASLASWDFEAARVVVASQAAESFVDVLAARERWRLLENFATIAGQIQKGVATRVQGEKASPIELDRATVSTARARALAEAERTRYDAARTKLATLWGAEHATFTTVSGELGRNRRAPTFNAVRAFLDENPQLARWSDEVGRRYAVLDLERAKAIPDITIGAGVRQLNEDNATALVATVSMPLKVFDGNQGNIAAAERRIAKSEFDAATARNQIVGSLVEVLGDLTSADAQVTAFETKVLPAAQSAFDRTRTGYEEGKYDFLNVLDTERSLFEMRLELVNARAEYEKARVKAEALIGRGLDEISP